MDKKGEFKQFIGNHPEILEYVKNKEMTFQDFYQIYDIYGEDMNVWNKYFKKSNDREIVSELKSIFKNVNIDNIQKHIGNAQKIIGILSELSVGKDAKDDVPLQETKITKFYGD